MKKEKRAKRGRVPVANPTAEQLRNRRRTRTLVVAPFPVELRDRLHAASKAHGLPVSEIIRRGIRLALADESLLSRHGDGTCPAIPKS